MFTTPNLKVLADILMKIGFRPIEDDLNAIEPAYNEELHAAAGEKATQPLIFVIWKPFHQSS